jgi:hypothetical protein
MFANAKWTHANVAVRLTELEAKYKQGGDAGAEAALSIGNVLYNMTRWGNARVMLSATHQETKDASPAMAWYKKAHDLAKNRELKAKAAFLAAKAELGTAISVAEQDPKWTGEDLPLPRTWYPVVKQYANTKYYKEVLAECGRFRSWVKKRP